MTIYSVDKELHNNFHEFISTNHSTVDIIYSLLGGESKNKPSVMLKVSKIYGSESSIGHAITQVLFKDTYMGLIHVRHPYSKPTDLKKSLDLVLAIEQYYRVSVIKGMTISNVYWKDGMDEVGFLNRNVILRITRHEGFRDGKAIKI